ncbi:protein of unknown function DUF2992 [Gottschalkia purinilytica]|uniref:DUF2992 family protein n=1 Tax=Gottschalkia purinilytica TaxID=1503 RepID=A0A0L0W7J1_GOTPU|nr:YjdF family protein [Gottschalkia purinilytica]KNF07513.1 protein of unknown function DUF2992 [Gottschalkia purinilytica]
MNKIKSKLTVYFDSPFWSCIVEVEDSDIYKVSKTVFGSEPKDYEVYEWILKEYYNLKFSSNKSSSEFKEKRINPKRLQRQVRKEINNQSIGTKAQEAIKESLKASKLERKKYKKLRKEEQKELKFQLKQQKKKEKHKGH